MSGSDTKELSGPDFAKGVAFASLEPGKPLLGHAGGEGVVVVRLGDRVCAVGASCTHYGAPLVDGHPFAAVKAYPQGDTSPEVWILGSSDYGAQVAAIFGLPFCFAWFFSDGLGAAQAVDIYRRTYRPSARHPAPHAGLCVWALAAESEAEAQRHFTPRAKWRRPR